jgi:zinc transporter
MDFDWLAEEDRLHIREAADRFARMTESWKRPRARRLAPRTAHRHARRADGGPRAVLSIVALIFLPLTFITGLLGMNVAGIPHADHPLAFWAVVGFCVVIALVISAYFARKHWLKR